MTARNQRDKNLFHHIPLANDDLAQFRFNSLTARHQFLEGSGFCLGGIRRIGYIERISHIENGKIWSVRHRIENDVDPQRVGNLLRKVVEIVIALALALPAIAVVRVVTRDDHEPSLVV